MSDQPQLVAYARRVFKTIMLQVFEQQHDDLALPDLLSELLRVTLRSDGWQYITMVPGDMPGGRLGNELIRHGYRRARFDDGPVAGWRWDATHRLWRMPVVPYDGRPRSAAPPLVHDPDE